MNTPRVAVIGAGGCGPGTTETARELGRLLAGAGFSLVSGGLEGVMRAASHGAREAGGEVIGLVPGLDRFDANDYVGVPLATGLGPMRNFLVVLNADIVVAVEGGWGTLSEIGLAKKIGRTVIALGHWSSLEGVIPASTPDEALELVIKHFKGRDA